MLGLYGEYSIQVVTEQDIELLPEIVCLDEILEVHILCNCTVQKMLSVLASDEKQTLYSLYYQEQLVGIGGLSPLPSLGNICAEIWFLGDDLLAHRRFIVEHGKSIVQKALEQYPVLCNQAISWNKKTLRMVQYLGFTVEEKPCRLGQYKQLFNRFYITK